MRLWSAVPTSLLRCVVLDVASLSTTDMELRHCSARSIYHPQGKVHIVRDNLNNEYDGAEDRWSEFNRIVGTDARCSRGNRSRGAESCFVPER